MVSLSQPDDSKIAFSFRYTVEHLKGGKLGATYFVYCSLVSIMEELYRY